MLHGSLRANRAGFEVVAVAEDKVVGRGVNDALLCPMI